MESLVNQLNTVAGVFVDVALYILLQSSLLILLVLLVEFAVRKRVRATLRYWFVMVVFAHLLLTPLFSLSAGAAQPRGVAPVYADAGNTSNLFVRAVAQQAVVVDVAAPMGAVLPEPTVTWQTVLFVAWLSGVVVMIVFLLYCARAAQDRVQRSQPANLLMTDILAYCRKCMGIREQIELRVSDDETKPTVCGLLEPVIIVPRTLAPTLGSRHLRAVLFHELAHIKRRDLWINAALTILMIVHFYNPLLWLASSALRKLREQAADEAVLETVGHKNRAYPQLLADVAKMNLRRPVFSLNLAAVT